MKKEIERIKRDFPYLKKSYYHKNSYKEFWKTLPISLICIIILRTFSDMGEGPLLTDIIFFNAATVLFISMPFVPIFASIIYYYKEDRKLIQQAINESIKEDERLKQQALNEYIAEEKYPSLKQKFIKKT